MSLSRLTPLALALLAATLPAQTPAPAPSAQLIAADRAILSAMSGPHADTAALTQLLAPDYSDIEDGESTSRADLLKTYAHLVNFTYDYQSPQATLLSPTTGYVVAEVRYTYPLNGMLVKRHKITTTTFVLRDAHWIATLHTETSFENDREDIIAKPSDSNPDVIAMRRLVNDVMTHVQVPGYAPFPVFPLSFDASTAISYSNRYGAHEADFTTLPPPMQQVWNQWATNTTDEPNGQALFKDMFYRFFLVHELGHLIAGRVLNGLPDDQRKIALANEPNNHMESELTANRIATAWFREHDPAYLDRLVADFRLIQAKLPNPVPPNTDPKRYFTDNYARLGTDPIAYGWYQLYMVITVYNEPAKTFQQTLATLPTLRYNEE